MTTGPSHDQAGNTAEAGQGLECPKCGRLTPPDARHCPECGAHLVVRCQRCGQRAPRALARCPHCGQRLHRSLWRKWRKKLFLRNYRLAPWQLGLLIVVAALVFYLIVKVAEIDLPVLF